jgi:hypothetical protein
MASQADVRRVAMALPGTVAGKDHFAFSVLNKDKEKGYAWVWKERIHPRKARVPNPEVLAIRVPGLDEKELLLTSDEEKFFTEPHYNGFPAVLVRLRAVRVPELRTLLTMAWRCQAPPALVEEVEGKSEGPGYRRRPKIRSSIRKRLMKSR